MRRPRSGERAFIGLSLAIQLGAFGCLGGAFAAEGSKNLQLEVFINGVTANMISSFVQFPDGTIGATPNELEELGLHTGLRRSPDEIVPLATIPTLHYAYIERTQSIQITIDNAYRAARIYDLQTASPAKTPRAAAGWGAVMNYDLLTTTGKIQAPFDQMAWFGGTSLTLDARAFSPYGTFEQSALLLSSQSLATQVVRLDTSFRYSDQQRMISYGLGDAITNGLPWTRPIRIGGAQAQSNFTLRPDLITMPLPSLGGTAAVPSTVDVYVNNIKTFSQDVPAGPFSINNVPLITGAGNAQLVIRDAAGQETKTSLPFYASASLLAPELTSWSVEGGLPRLSYGSNGDTYLDMPMASLTLRRGIFDWMTLESHAEAGSGLIDGGLGTVLRTGTFGVASAAISGSSLSSSRGLQTYLSYETRLFGLDINASLQRTFGVYNDLASATARLQAQLPPDPTTSLYGFLSYAPYVAPTAATIAMYTDFRPPLELEHVSVGAPLPFDKAASWNLSLLRQVDALSNVVEIASATYSRSLPFNASLFATAFRDFGTAKSTGVVAGLSIPFGESASVTTSVSGGGGRATTTVDAVKSLGSRTGDIGWEVRDSEGASPYRSATLSYRTGYFTAKVGASDSAGYTNAGLELRGSISTMGRDVFFADWIDDGFAVVDVGSPGVEVSYENRPVGKTDSHGMLLVPTLRSYQRNLITVDPTNMPADAEIENTREITDPADRAGVLVKFKVRNDAMAALVVFVRPDGSFVPAGAAGTLAGGEQFIVGYDGMSFIRELGRSNSAIIAFDATECHATFDFLPSPGEQVRIGPVSCK